MKLDILIRRLEKVRNEGLMKLNKKQIEDIFFEVIKKMAEYTIVDTGQARSAVIDTFADRYGYNVSYLFSETFNFWQANGFPENKDRGRRRADVIGEEILDKNEFSFETSINDEALYAQNFPSFNSGVRPSSLVPNRDNSKYITNHIQVVSDSYITYDEVKDKVNALLKNIEKIIFK